MKIYGLYPSNLTENAEPITIAKCGSIEEAIKKFSEIKRLEHGKFLEVFRVSEIVKNQK